ncbi:MAG: FG-GAP-like repeat-containing protein, partial [Bdellovibrionota bacterium]|nr:FG-GAP-like repeat-containing protein [Bdellovibrionota bacterium]
VMKSFWKKIYLWLAVIALALSGSVYSGGGGESDKEKAEREQRERDEKQEKSKKAGKFEDLAPLTYTDDEQEPISPQAHGRLTGKFSISKKSGSAEYNIPITVAKGFKGLSPGLSLHYQSDGQNGAYGVGWSLGGIPSLSRCGTNAKVDGVETYNREVNTKVVEKGRKYYIKNKKGLKFNFMAGVNKGMQLSFSDQLCFNGVRLKLKSGTHGRKGAEYRSIHDRWIKAKITDANFKWYQLGCLSASHDYCIIKVYDSTGKVTAFSNYSHHDKRTFFPEYTEDKKGNRLEYHWTNEYDKETLLASVNYVSNPKTGRKASRRVHFYYDDRPDKKKSYSGGYEFKSYKRLKKIEAHHRSGTSDWLVTNRWHLKYKTSKTTRRSLLTSVQLCDGMTGEKCLPATEFDYSEGVNPLKAFSQNDKKYHFDKASPTIKFESLSSKVVGDVNGDGLADLVWVERDKGSRSQCGPFEKNKANDGVDMACSSLNQFSNGQGKFGPKKCVCMKNDSEAPSSLILPGDHDNDGKMDLIYFSAVSKHFTNHRVMVVRGGVNGFEEPSFIENEERSESVHLNNKTSWGMLGDFVYRGNVHSKQSVKDLGKEAWGTNYPRMLGDFNGDGIKDMLGFAHNNVVVHLGELKGNNKDKPRLGYGSNWLSQMTKGKGGWNSDKHPRMTGDVTGDGLADIIGFASKNVSVAVNTGKDFRNGRNWHSGFGSSDGWKLHRHKRIMSDVNGDGLMDIIAFGESKTMVYVSTGSSFKWFWDSKDFAAKEWDEGNEPRFAQDLNGDGMADLIGFSNDGHIVVRYATGTGFGPLHSVSSSGTFTGKKGWTGENNPRMFADVNGDGLPDLIGYANNWANVVINQNADAERGIPADKIVKVTDGYGEPLDIEYATIIHGEKGLRQATGQLGGKDVPHYQSTKTYKYPQSGNVGSEPIVKKTTLSNSAGTDVETEYFYKNMSNNVNGLGSEGFEVSVSKNVETGAHVEETFLQPFPKSRKPQWRYVRDADGNVSASEQYTHTNASQDNDYSSGSNDSWITDNLHEIRQAEHISYNGWEGSSAETNRTKSYYGKSGLNYKIEVIPTEIGGDKGYVKCNQFLVDEDRWLIYLPTEERTNKAGEDCYFGNELGDSISAKRLTYNSYGEVTKEEVLLPNSQKNTTTYSWDRDGGLLKMREPNGARTTYELDNGKYGHMFNTKTCNEYNHCELRTYHHTGQVATKISTTGTISKVVVDSFGRTTAMWGAHRDPNVPMEDESDLYKLRAITYTKPLNKKDGVLLVKNWIRSSWDTPKGNAVIGGKGSNLFEFEYIDVVGNKIKTEKSGRKINETKTWTVKYNSAGQVIEKLDPHSINGKKAINQVKFEFYPGSPRIKRSWNPRTNVDVTYTYDDYGLTTIESYPSPSSDGGGRRTVTKEKTVNGKLLRKYSDGDESTAMVYEY